MADRASNGFTAWVDRLARAHTRGLATVASREGLAAEDAVDAVQEAFVTLLAMPQARSLADHDEDAFSLLGAIVRNAARNARRRHHRARPHVSVDDEPLLDEGLSIDEWIARAEEHVALLGCVAKLGEIQRHVVTLRLLEQMSTTDVAASLTLTPGTVAVLLHRAKTALQRCLAADEALVA